MSNNETDLPSEFVRSLEAALNRAPAVLPELSPGCLDEEGLALRFEGRLPPDAEAQADEHIKQCVRCSELLNFLVTAVVHSPNIAEFRKQSAARPAARIGGRSGRRLFRIPAAAAAAGGTVRQRSSPDATIRLIGLAEVPNQIVVTIQLKDPMLRPRLLRLDPPDGPILEQALPPPDRQGRIQLIKDVTFPEERRFVELVLEVPLDFLGEEED
ncbi:MAG: hypothetical protein JOZ29_10925 [Deltaproteobacteria bacterium]|nr:hypothetical protein [Deltaproteobacteria bacterium]